MNRAEANSPRWPLVAAGLPEHTAANCLRYSRRPGVAAPTYHIPDSCWRRIAAPRKLMAAPGATAT